MEKGNLSINSENFLPIIKKWLYTDTDIFLRELVSNACDAVTKLLKLKGMGEASNISEYESFKIEVVINKEEKTVQIIDNGIGMTADEIKEYINQIAFSGANSFIEKYAEQMDNENENEIIGHFGLGFYSAFMVSTKVVIDTLSFKDGEKPAKWTCEGGIEFEMEEGTRTERGTTITLHINEDGESFLDEYNVQQALRKYCSFMPVEIFVEKVKTEEELKAEEEAKKEEFAKNEDGENIIETDEEGNPLDVVEARKPINDTTPLWLKQPNECTDDEYISFYEKVFPGINKPLFWIHLNMDYPFNLKGILYFPKLKADMDLNQGEIKLYSNQVYIADNIKEVVPEFLLLLKGVIDCKDLPLNVSRSALQNDGYAAKMSTYISKKVSDKITKLFKTERERYEEFYDDICVFIKYGCIKEEKMYGRVKDAMIYNTTEGAKLTLAEYSEKYKDQEKVYYATDTKQQAQYINMFKEQNMEALVLEEPIDKHFISFLEYQEKELKFTRIDSSIDDFVEGADAEETDESKALNESLQVLFENATKGTKTEVKAQSLKTSDVSSMILLSEEARRLVELREMYKDQLDLVNLIGQQENEETLVLNTASPIVKKLIEIKDDDSKKEDVSTICDHLYDLALLGHKTLTNEEMTKFISRSNLILEKLATI